MEGVSQALRMKTPMYTTQLFVVSRNLERVALTVITKK
jgi:hypothetical protein